MTWLVVATNFTPPVLPDGWVFVLALALGVLALARVQAQRDV